jgi:hypothetical protein
MTSHTPIVPTNFEPTAGTSTSVTLTWDDAFGTPSQTPTTYSVWWRYDGNGNKWTLAAPPIYFGYGQDNYLDLVNLRPQTSYQFKLVATNPFGAAETKPIVYVTQTYRARP